MRKLLCWLGYHKWQFEIIAGVMRITKPYAKYKCGYCSKEE